MNGSMVPVLWQALYLLLPLVCVAAIPPVPRGPGLAQRLVFGVALYELLLLAIGLSLGTAGLLTPPLYRAALAGVTLLLASRVSRTRPSFRLPGVRRAWRTRRGLAALALAGLAAAVCAVELGFDAFAGTRHGDGLWYHIPRVLFWLGQGSFEPWTTPVAASLGLPVGADLVLLHKMLLGLGWAGAGYATFWLAAGASGCVYLGARAIGLARWNALLAALLFFSFPAVGLRVWSASSDVAAAFPALAACVALARLRSPPAALSAFVVLLAAAVACKPTVVLPASVPALLVLWHCRGKVFAALRSALPWGAAAAGAALVLAAYWPVYLAFGDFLGGSYARQHQSVGAGELLHAVGMHTAYWVLEPLGYLTRFRSPWQLDALKTVYNAVGARFDTVPDVWRPYPGQDTGFTGLIPLLLLPFPLAGLRRNWRRVAVPALVVAYLPLAGMIRPQPYFTRFNVVLLAGVALVWAGTRFFAAGRARWWLAGAVCANLAALLGVASLNVYLHATTWSRDGGAYSYLSAADRASIAASLHGRPLLVLAESSERISSMDALLPGPSLAFPLRYVVCPPSRDWREEARRLPGTSNWLALVHNGLDTVAADPAVLPPGSLACGAVPKKDLDEALSSAGWRRHRAGRLVDLWTYARAAPAKTQLGR